MSADNEQREAAKPTVAGSQSPPAVTSVEADTRRQVLRDLETAARRGLEAACSAAVR